MRVLDLRESALGGTREIAGAIGSVVRAVLVSVLTLLEMVIVWICSTISAGAVVMALFYRLAAPAGHFPYGLVFTIGGGALAVMTAYYVLLAALSDH